MKISKRLKDLSEHVLETDIVGDIGCDHALLDIYMVSKGIIPKSYASDVNEKALNCGINNINKYNLNDKITIKLDNGIENIPSDINTLIISGMGSSTIIKILSNSNLNQINKLIIQSNNDYYLLRKFLINKGFYIYNETCSYDNNKYYINIVFKRGKKHYNKYELKYGPILKDKDYFNYLLNKYKDIYNKVPKSKIIYKLKLRKIIYDINKKINA